MNNPIFWRLVWKEYRLMRNFWIAMAVLTVILELILCVTVWNEYDRVPMIFFTALALPAFYAMGCGATLFSTEHETGTYQFQRALPVSAWRLFLGKIPFGLVSTPLLFLVLWASAWIISGLRFPEADFHAGIWGLCGIAALEFFLWGVFFSLLCRQPMKAAILAAIFGSTTIHFFAVMGIYQWRAEIYLEPRTIPYRLAVAALVAVANVWLGFRWLRDGSTSAGDDRQLGQVSIGRKAADVLRGAVGTRSTILGRLAWQQWRQSRRMMVVLAAMTVPILAFMVANWIMFFGPGGSDTTRTSANLPLWVTLALAAAPLAGASVFMADQRRRSFRFLTQRGVSARHVWIGRQVVWILAVACGTMLLVLPWVVFPVVSWLVELQETARYGEAYDPMQDTAVKFAFLGGMCFAHVMGAYAAGQLCSMFFRSGILAGFFALLLSVGLVAWSVLMFLAGIPWIWSIAPIPLIPLVATWLRAPYWLLERNGIKGWWSTASWLTATVGLLLAAVMAYRVYQIPLITPGFSPEEFSRPASAEAQATAEMYCRAGDLIEPISKLEHPTKEETDEENLARRRAWIEANRAVIEMAMEASRRPECDGLEPPGRERLGDAGDDLACLLVGEARLLGTDGDLDAALQRYLAALRISSHIRPRSRCAFRADHIERTVYNYLKHWAAKPGQTPERIRTAVEAIEQIISQPPSRTDTIKAEYCVARQIVEGDTDLLGNVFNDPEIETVREVVAMQWMPWEKARAVRLLDWSTLRALTRMESIEQALANGTSLPMGAPSRYYCRWWPCSALQVRLYNTTIALRHFHGPGWWSGEAKMLVDTATQRRATCLVLALAAWKLEHGELPDKLDDLVGPYLTKLPPDPHSGEPFRYFRKGIPIAITHRYYRDDDDKPIELVGAEEPFIWSTGWHLTFNKNSKTTPTYDEYYTNELDWRGVDTRRTFRSEHEIWQRGECFTIP